MNPRPDLGVFGIAPQQSCSAFLILTGLLAIGCALNPSPRQMYEGAPLPKEQVGIVRTGCTTGSGLTIMTTQIDGKDIADGCADFALLPGEHQIELSAKQLAPKFETGMMGSGSVLGAPPTPMGARPDRKSPSSAPGGWGSTGGLDVRNEHVSHLRRRICVQHRS